MNSFRLFYKIFLTIFRIFYYKLKIGWIDSVLSDLLNYLALFIIILLLTIATIKDIKYREVEDWVWVLTLIVGSILHVSQIIIILLDNGDITNYLIPFFVNVIIAFFISFLLFFLGIWGGADAFALFSIVYSFPLSINIPLIHLEIARLQTIAEFIPIPFDIFMNSYILLIPVPFILLFKNMLTFINKRDLYDFKDVNLIKRIQLLISGYPFSVEKLSSLIKDRPWHYDIIEELNEEGKWIKPVQYLLDDPDKDIQRKLDTISDAHKDNKEYLWVSPSIPYLAALDISFIVTILFKNIIFAILLFLLNT